MDERSEKHKNVTALLLGILLLSMAGAREWIADVWRQFNVWERFLWAFAFAALITFALAWSVAETVWQWGHWLFGAIGI